MITTPGLTKSDLADATARALSLCPDINCQVAVFDTLKAVNLSVSVIGGRLLGDSIEAEAERRRREKMAEDAPCPYQVVYNQGICCGHDPCTLEWERPCEAEGGCWDRSTCPGCDVPRRADTFTSLGDAAANVVAEIERKEL